MKAAQRPATHHHRVGAQQRFLPLLADSRKQNLPRIALALRRVHVPDGNRIALNRLRYHEDGASDASPTLPAPSCCSPRNLPTFWRNHPKYEGKPILTIQFDPKRQPLDPSELHDILPLQKDQPLRMADVRASIERLFATGRYADIQVDAEPISDGAKDGVIVRFLTKNSWFIGAVTAAGRISSPPRAGTIGKRSRLSTWGSRSPKPRCRRPPRPSSG